EEDALAPQVRRPSPVDARAMGEQPTPDNRFSEASALLARCGSGKIAQPGKALQLLRQRISRADRREIEVLERQRFAAESEASGQQGIAARSVPPHMIPRDGDELERL